MAEQARVWLADAAGGEQHFAAPPQDEVAKRWDGVTACGVSGELSWIPPERVDGGLSCAACTAVVGTAPVLEGDYPGPP